jgi:hypothetical protein
LDTPLQDLSPSPHPPIPQAVRDRRFRAHSFAANLTAAQRLTLVRWLGDPGLSLADIQHKIAAPAPDGFGVRVHHSAVRRLRSMLENKDLEHWLDEAMDLACDLLEPSHAAEIAPLRESLIYILYSQAIQKSRELFLPREMSHLAAAIDRLEKMKDRAHRLARSPRSNTPSGQLRLDVTVRQPTQRKKRPKVVRPQAP